ncbi:c-type cytochrome [Flavobacterium crassostreae]|uniref:Cytochrome C552 n=1 Tax=Flavobacterium crassostreae TaxID=1763534 RepID=A0A1B9E0H9_9FLAO|nr:c-type cytochrome [Flavobacterium crassostreae]OCB75418.1 cytochrome C552 [Flavobacterium crassostreae]
MKKILFITIALLALGCKNSQKEAEPFGAPQTTQANPSEGMPAQEQTPEALGQTLFNGKGNCATCHKVDVKTIGPSLQEIAKIYKEKSGNIVTFLKGEGQPLVDPSQYEVMKANFALTKTMSDQELKGLEAYIYSTLQ